MKKRWLDILLALLLIACSSSAFAETTIDTGIWEVRAYVDEFDMPTDEYYISNAEPIIGKFSNSATTNSLLNVYLYVDMDSELVSIKLIEYGNMIVKNTYSRSQEYDVVMMDPSGSKHYLNGTMASGGSVIFIEENDEVLSALNGEGTVRFAISEQDDPITKYIFSIEDTSGLALCKKQSGYKSIGSLIKDGMVCVSNSSSILGSDWGAVDITGNLVVPLEYDYAFHFSEGLACVVKDGKMGYIDTDGNIAIPFQYEGNIITAAFGRFSEGLAAVFNGKFGYIDKTGETVIPYSYDLVSIFREGRAPVKKDGKMGYIDVEGNVIIPLQYDDTHFFQEGMAPVEKDGKWEYIDVEGNVAIPYRYDAAGDFSEGLAAVRKNGQWGYIDKNGNVIIPYQYDSASIFAEGMAWVEKNGKLGCINTGGEEIIPCQYDDAGEFSSGYACVQKNGRWGIVDTAGNLVITCMYDQIAYGEGHLILLKDGELTTVSCDELE